MRSAFHRFLVGISIVVAVLVASSASRAQPAGAQALEARLYAPCCYGGTLDIHESELARSLRTEIEGRLARGESSDAIQADFVTRYGDKVVAARSDAPLRAMGVGLAVLAMLAAAGLLVVVRRWTRRSASADAFRPVVAPRDDLDGRIDAELADLDS